MGTLPQAFAFALLFSVCAVWAGLVRFWMRQPDKAQALARRVFLPFFKSTIEVVTVLYKIVRWVVTLLVAYVVLIGLTLPYLAMVLAWVTLKKVAGEKALISVKLN